MNHVHHNDNDEPDEIDQLQEEQLNDREDSAEDAASHANEEEDEADGSNDDDDDEQQLENDAVEQVQEEEENFGEVNQELYNLWMLFHSKCDQVRANAPDMTEFDVSLILDDTDAEDLGTALEGNTHLERLNLHLGPEMSPDGAVALVRGIRGSNVQQLQVFWHGANGLPLQLAEVYLQPIIHTSLEILNLQFPIDETNLNKLGRALLGNESLKTLGIRVDGVTTRSGMLPLAEGICHSRIQTLMLMGFPDVSTTAIRSVLLNGIRHCSTLLDLRTCGVGEDLVAVAAVLPKLHAFTFSPYGGLSIPQVRRFAYGLSHAKELVSVRIRGGDWEGEKLLLLFQALFGFRHSVMVVQLFALPNFGDEEVATLVEHWSPFSGVQSLSLDGNKIGPKGVLRLLEAMSSRCGTMLTLDNNKGIGYDGLTMIGKELAGKRLFGLSLGSVASWIDYDDATCHEAVVQSAKRAAASEALLEGVRGNVYLLQLELDGLNLLPHVIAEIKVYLMANRRGRLLVMNQYKAPPALFCFLLAQQTKMHHDILFLYLRELPTVIASSQRSDASTTL